MDRGYRGVDVCVGILVDADALGGLKGGAIVVRFPGMHFGDFAAEFFGAAVIADRVEKAHRAILGLGKVNKVAGELIDLFHVEHGEPEKILAQ